MRLAIYNPTPEQASIINPYNDPAGLTYTSNSSLAYWGGKWWAAFDGSTTGIAEGHPDQQIWMTTSTDAATWQTAFQPFRDADYCTNPGVPDNPPLDWQPNLVAVGDELWCTWTHGAGFLSKLSDPEGKWTNYRFEFDGTDVYLSETISGDASAGRSLTATFDGISDWSPFFACNPIILSTGVVAMPVTLLSTTLSDQIVTPSTFTRQLKRNAVIFADGDTYTLALIDTSAFGDFSAWEPFVVENPAGHIYVYSRNMNPLLSDEDFMHVAVSYDGGATFEPSVSTKMFVPSTRGYAGLVTSDRWVMTHIDKRAGSVERARQALSKNRINGAVFISRRGSNDFAPGINFSGRDAMVNYPQFCVGPADVLYINYTSGDGVNQRRSLEMVTLPAISNEKSLVMPRSAATYSSLSDPPIRGTSPLYFDFNGARQLRSAEELAVPGTAVTYAVWARSYGGGATLCDARDSFGHVLTLGGVSLTGVTVRHGEPIRPGVNFFLAAVIDAVANTITFYVSTGDGITTTTGHFRSILFSANPSDGDTVTVDGTTYTFRDTADEDGEVQIAELLTETIVNLDSAISSRAFLAYPAEIFEGRLLMARADGADFTVTSGSAAITLEAEIPLDGGLVRWGSPDGGALTPWSGRIYDGRLYTSALSEANIRWLFNRLADDFGYDTVAGTATDPGDPEFWANPDDLDTDVFPPSGNPEPGYCEQVESEVAGADVLRIWGEESAAVEMPYSLNEVTIRWRCGATPTAGERCTIATFGVGDFPARLYIDGDNPTKLYLGPKQVGTVSATDWTNTTVTVATNYAKVGDNIYFAQGKPRCYLGDAFPQGLLLNTKYVDFDVARMKVVKA